MKRCAYIFFLLSISALLAGCGTEAEPAALLDEAPGSPSFFLFSNEENMKEEKPFYDALLTYSNACGETGGAAVEILSQSAGMNNDTASFLFADQDGEMSYDGEADAESIYTFMEKQAPCPSKKE